ncbi:MAG TPA: hypothetical protein PK561_07230 [Fervidobacterium sp.]|nr:hypothetical protein [Fervidobacterium sp.]
MCQLLMGEMIKILQMALGIFQTMDGMYAHSEQSNSQKGNEMVKILQTALEIFQTMDGMYAHLRQDNSQKEDDSLERMLWEITKYYDQKEMLMEIIKMYKDDKGK